MPTFTYDGHELAYTEYGQGPRTVILMHGLLLAQTMQAPLARELASHGNRVITLDLLGHGLSDRPTEMWSYSMVEYGREVVALLDHLEVDQAVLMGTSLGANTSLEVAVAAPERVRGMIIEMPVLDNALLGCALGFTPLLVSLTFGAPIMRGVAEVSKRIPRGPLPFLSGLMLDVISQDPKPSASILQGLFFGRVAPARDLRRTIEAPTLIIGHKRDPIHPFSDAGMLYEELPNGRLVEADSIAELRSAPDRLTREIDDFVDACWAPKRAPKRKPRAPKAAAR